LSHLPGTLEQRLADLNTVDRKPLYLNLKNNPRVRCEGSALRIDGDGRAPVYIPLRRLSRIVASQHAAWDTEALLACADRGITILIVREDGGPAARVMGRPGERQELRQRLLDLIQRPDWKTLYGGWLYAIERQILIDVQRRMLGPHDLRTPAQIRQWINRRALRWADPRDADNLRHWINELATAWMHNHCQQLGIGSADSELLADGRPDVAADLARLLCWQTETLRLGWLQRRRQWAERHAKPLRPVTRRNAIRLFEQHGARMGIHGRELTNRLHYWLVDLH